MLIRNKKTIQKKSFTASTAKRHSKPRKISAKISSGKKIIHNVETHEKYEPKSKIKRRSQPRIKTDKYNCKIFLDSDSSQFSGGMILNASSDGFLLATSEAYQMSSILFLTVFIDNEYHQIEKIRCRVIWSKITEEYGVLHGLNITHFNIESDSKRYNNYLRDLESKSIVVDRRNTVTNKTKKDHNLDKERRTSKEVFRKCLYYPRLKHFEEAIFRPISSISGTKITINNQQFISFSSCDYLGLNKHPKIIKAMKAAIDTYGSTSGASRFLSGTFEKHITLENELTQFIGGDDTLVYTMGFLANLGGIPTFMDKDGLLLFDEQCHASIIDSCKISGSRMIPYRHCDSNDLERKLKKYGHKKTMIITDGVFSMDGDLAKLDDLYNLGQQYGAGLYVDDAHGIGVIGENGSGICEYYGLQGKIDMVMGTLSKAIPCLGGYIAGNQKIIDYLRWSSRTFMFTLSLPMQFTCGTLAALEVIKKEPQHLLKLRKNVTYLKNNLRNLGFEVYDSISGIVPVIIRNDEKTCMMVQMLKEKGIFIDGVVYPVVKRNMGRIRFVLSALHTIEELDYTIKTFEKAGKKLNLI